MMQTMKQPGIPRVIKYREGTPMMNPQRQTLYHRRQFAAATAQTLTFFRDFTATTALDTNMTTPAMLPSPYAFSCYGISFFVDQGVVNTDWHKLLNETVIFFKLSGKDKLQIPLHMVPSAGGLYGISDAAAAPIFEAQNGMPMPTNFLPLDVQGRPVHIVSQQDFQVNVQTFNSAAFSAAFYGFCHLHGIYYIPVQ